MKDKIKAAIKETLVIQNQQSIDRAVKKIMAIAFTEMDLYAYYFFTLPRKVSSMKGALTPEEWHDQVRSKGAILDKPIAAQNPETSVANPMPKEQNPD